ncbi:hypothetical protein F4805DRAFT_426468 [Annulohypoxylon moriforme]|nr:hypothetical protein F4805DRAFT_426468 [Annulohypoxylon moriforme]
MAFKHYKNNLEKPFDFLESLLAARPLDGSLSTIFFILLRAAMKAYRSTTTEMLASEFCRTITPIVCSIITLDSYRSRGRHPGLLKNIYTGSMNFRVGEADGVVTYQSQFSAAITDFLEKSCPCDFVYEGKRCVNSLRGHKAYMHQDETGDKYFGTFESKFVDDWMQCWNEVIDECFDELDNHLGESDTAGQSDESVMAWPAHCLNLRNLYLRLPQLDVTNIKICSWCFRDKPLRSLECGHWVCWSCAELVGVIQPGSSNDNNIVAAVSSCELHSNLVRFEKPIHVIKKPETGAIVLSNRNSDKINRDSDSVNRDSDSINRGGTSLFGLFMEYLA